MLLLYLSAPFGARVVNYSFPAMPEWIIGCTFAASLYVHFRWGHRGAKSIKIRGFQVMDSHTFFSHRSTINLNGSLLSLHSPVVMGILNITPDSFFDGGRFIRPAVAVERMGEMLDQGAHIIDVGGVSSRPGAKAISEEEEEKRLVPMVKRLAVEFPQAVMSVDTFRARIAQKAIEAGASMVNDISGGLMDKDMFHMVAQLKVPYVLMHMQGTPGNMQKDPRYQDVVTDISRFFAQQLYALRKRGVEDVILDPGFGFGKTLDHNYTLLKELRHFRIFECPVLVGVSRKSMVNKLLGVSAEAALNGTTALHMAALDGGVRILRVHDVKEARETIKIWEKLNE